MSQLQVTGEAKIRDLQGPVVANSGVVTALDGAASQYVRGDGTLADFPTQTGGGSSVSYYLNGSVNQGTFGGSTYYQMSKNAITGTGTNFSTSADGLLAQFITDANDPDATSIPSGNWNIEFFMNVSASSGALASFYVEFYKYNGTTFTLVATNVATPEVLTGTTTIDAYYTSVAFPETALLQTDRLAIRIYANVASKTVTLYTEDNRLCQVVTTFSRGILSLNNLTDQQQYFAVGTSGSDFNIVSSLDTHTFNIPTASATKRGLLSTTDWSTFNNKVPYTGATDNVDLGTNNLFASFLYAEGAGGTSNGGLLIKQYSGAITAGVGYTSLFAPINQLGINFGGAYNALIEGTTLSANRTFTLPNITGTFALLEGNQNFIGFKQFSDTNSTWLDYGISMAKGSTPSSLSSSRVNVYSNSGDKNLVIADTFASFAKLQFQATGDLTYTFPSSSGTIALTSNLSSYVPYTGATTNVNLGFNLLTTNSINLDGNSASGVLNIKSNSSISTSGAGYVSLVSGNVNQLSFVFNGGNSATFTSVSLSASRTYSLPDASGTISLTSDLSAYVTLATTQTISGAKTFSATPVFDNGVSGMPLRFKTYGAIGLGVSGYTDIAAVGTTSLGFAFGVSASATKLAYFAFGDISDNIGRTYTFPNADGTIALTSNLSAYVTLATNQTISGQKTFTQNLLLDGNGSNAGTLLLKSNTALPTSIGYTSINSTTNNIYLTTFVSNPKTAALDLSGLSDNAVRTFTFPNTSGTIALTSNLSSYLPLTGGTLTGALSGTSATFSGALDVRNANSFFGSQKGYVYIFEDQINSYFSTDADATLVVNYVGYNQGTTRFRSFDVYNGKATRLLNINGVTGAATFSSSVSGGGYLANGSTTIGMPVDTGGTKAYFDASSINGPALTLRADSVGRTLRMTSDGSGTVVGAIDANSSGLNIGTNTSHPIIFNPQATERMRITSGGNVGIGTSITNTLLNVNIPSSSTNGLSLIDGSTIPVVFTYSSVTGENRIGGLLSYVFPTFYSGGSERMRITSGGKVVIGATSTTYGSLLGVQTSGSASPVTHFYNSRNVSGDSCFYMQMGSNARNTSSYYLQCFDTTDVLYIYGNGNIVNANGSYGTLSDISLKENITYATPKLDDLLKLKVRNFNLINDETKTKQIGFIAQEFEEVFPTMIDIDGKSGMKTIKTSVLVPMHTKAIQELYDLVQEQQAQIEELSNKIVALESK